MIEIEESDLMDLIHWSRRYCDGRRTYAVSSFNELYDRIRDNRPILFELQDKFDDTLTDDGKYFPHAKDGDFKAWPNKWQKDS